MPVNQVSAQGLPWRSLPRRSLRGEVSRAVSAMAQVSVGNAMMAATSCMLARKMRGLKLDNPERDLGIADALTIELDLSLVMAKPEPSCKSSACAISDCPGVTTSAVLPP